MYVTLRVEVLHSRIYDYRELHSHLSAISIDRTDRVDGKIEQLPPGLYSTRAYPNLEAAKVAILCALRFVVTADLRFVLRGPEYSTGFQLKAVTPGERLMYLASLRSTPSPRPAAMPGALRQAAQRGGITRPPAPSLAKQVTAMPVPLAPRSVEEDDNWLWAVPVPQGFPPRR
jgi:hypothetical protein